VCSRGAVAEAVACANGGASGGEMHAQVAVQTEAVVEL